MYPVILLSCACECVLPREAHCAPATLFSPPCTWMVIFFDINGGSCGTWSPSPIRSCSVCVPGGRSTKVSVCPSPKRQIFLVVRVGVFRGGGVGIDQRVRVAGFRLMVSRRCHAEVAGTEP